MYTIIVIVYVIDVWSPKNVILSIFPELYPGEANTNLISPTKTSPAGPKTISRSSQSIKIDSNQVISSIDNGNQWRRYTKLLCHHRFFMILTIYNGKSDIVVLKKPGQHRPSEEDFKAGFKEKIRFFKLFLKMW